METLNLTQVNAFAIEAADDEKTSSIKGYYKNKNTARICTKKAGWYNSDGVVIPVAIYEDNNGGIYKVESLGKYKDADIEFQEEIMIKIKQKLTLEEQEFLGIE